MLGDVLPNPAQEMGLESFFVGKTSVVSQNLEYSIVENSIL